MCPAEGPRSELQGRFVEMHDEQVVATPAFLLVVSDEDNVSPVDGHDHQQNDDNVPESDFACTPCQGANIFPGHVCSAACNDKGIVQSSLSGDGTPNRDMPQASKQIINSSQSSRLVVDAAAATSKNKGRRFLMDFGSGFDLESYKTLSKHERELTRMIQKRITLWTAAGKNLRQGDNHLGQSDFERNH